MKQRKHTEGIEKFEQFKPDRFLSRGALRSVDPFYPRSLLLSGYIMQQTNDGEMFYVMQVKWTHVACLDFIFASPST